MYRNAIVLAAALLAVAGCTSKEPKPGEAGESVKLGKYSKDEVKQHASKLLSEMAVGNEVSMRVMNRLDELLADKDFAPKLENPGVRAVGAFVYGGGGFVIRGGGGSMLVDFADSTQQARYEAKGWSIGANVGGDNNFGIVLAVGLETQADFQDNYSNEGTSGTVGESGYIRGTALPGRTGTHRLYYCGTAIGFSGTAALTGKVEITPAAPQEGEKKPEGEKKDGEKTQ